MAKGKDPQIEAAVKVVLEELKKAGTVVIRIVSRFAFPSVASMSITSKSNIVPPPNSLLYNQRISWRKLRWIQYFLLRILAHHQ